MKAARPRVTGLPLVLAGLLALLTALPALAQGGAAPATPTTSEPNLMAFALTGFGAGLLALLTPCVFPMIPITFAFFTKQATETGTSILKLATAYCLGIIITFTGFGAVTALVLGPAGANRLAANPWVNLVFAAIFIVFGLALLEVLDLTLPPAIQRLVGGPSSGDEKKKKSPIATVLFMGLTFVVAAFTCTAPFIGTVLVAAASAGSAAGWVRPIVGMASFSTALALPFFLLALFPGLLAKLPRSGAWMTTVKGAMGFIELGAALKFISNADLVWQWGIITRSLILAVWTVLTFGAAAWLTGKLEIGPSTPSGRMTVGRGLSVGLFAALGVFFLVGLTGQPLPGLEGAFLPPPSYGYAAKQAAPVAETTTTAAAAREFKNDLPGAIAEAKKLNRLIFVDFTGYTCANCRDMEARVFPLPEAKAEMDKFVRVALYTDEEKQKNAKGEPLSYEYQDYEEKLYGTISQPLYGILYPDGKPVLGPDGKPMSIGHVKDPAEFVKFLKAVQTQAGLQPAVTAQREFKNDLPGAIAEAKKLNRLVFVDFTGYTCANCRDMEARVFPLPEAKAEMDKFVRVALYTDEEVQKNAKGEPLSYEYQDYEEKQYGTISQPLYGILKPDGKPVLGPDGKPMSIGHVKDPAQFVTFLKEVQKQAGI